MKNNETWEDQFDRITEDNDGQFGHNVEFDDAKKYLKKLDKVSASLGKIEVLDEYTIRITLPAIINTGIVPYRENLLLHLLTELPAPSECRFNKKKNQLTVEWHY